jgi:hypothetical protein
MHGDEKCKHSFSQTGRNHWEGINVDGRMMLRPALTKWSVRICTAFIWFRTGSVAALVNTVMYVTFVFHIRMCINLQVERLSAFRKTTLLHGVVQLVNILQ